MIEEEVVTVGPQLFGHFNSRHLLANGELQAFTGRVAQLAGKLYAVLYLINTADRRLRVV